MYQYYYWYYHYSSSTDTPIIIGLFRFLHLPPSLFPLLSSALPFLPPSKVTLELQTMAIKQ